MILIEKKALSQELKHLCGVHTKPKQENLPPTQPYLTLIYIMKKLRQLSLDKLAELSRLKEQEGQK